MVNLLDEDHKSPCGNIVRRNVFWPGRGENIRRVQYGEAPKDTWWDAIAPNIRRLVTLEDNLINEDPKFVDEKAGNFQLRLDSPAWKLGFERIPFERSASTRTIDVQAGRSGTILRPDAETRSRPPPHDAGHRGVETTMIKRQTTLANQEMGLSYEERPQASARRRRLRHRRSCGSWAT